MAGTAAAAPASDAERAPHEQEIIDAEVVHGQPVAAGTSTELAVSAPAGGGGALSATTPVQAADLVQRLDTIKDAMDNAMLRDIDYGKVPGTDKPTLLKPGAEKLAVLFQLDVQITHDERWGPGDHLTVAAYATVFHAPTGTRLGRGEGLCTTRERKYAYRKQDRTCPTCGREAIIKGKAEYGGGWLCWPKRGGCNAKFTDGAAAIEGQEVGEIENPDLPDLWNTVIKMARKRALTDAVLLVTGASALFTQDVEASDAAANEEQSAPAQEALPFGPKLEDRKELVALRKAIAFLLGTSEGDARVTDVCREIAKHTGGYLPQIAGLAVRDAARAVKKHRQPEAQPEPEPTEEPPPPSAGEQQTLDDRPPAGMIEPPKVISSETLKAAGCICSVPPELVRSPKEVQVNDDCPIKGHGIPF